LLKNAGYDHVVIEGRADRPVVLKIIDDEVEICDGRSLWGKGVDETSEALREDFGSPLGVLAIGQAGENLSSFSMAFIDRVATLGRGGFGAVMGSKNLKAIAVKGTRGIQVSDRKRYKALNDALFKRIREYPHLKERQDFGLVSLTDSVPRDIYEKIKKRRMACVSCPVGDKDVVEIPTGRFQGLVACSPSAVNLFIPLIYGFKDYAEAIKCVSVLDGYGLDMFEFFGVMTFAEALSDHGFITRDMAQDEIRVDSLASMETWARKIALREGLGRVLADGFNGILREFGQEAKEYAPSVVKGMLPYVEPQGPVPWHLFGTMELGQVLDPRGPHVGASGSPTYFERRPLDLFPRHLDRMGAEQEAIHRVFPSPDSAERDEDLRIGRLLKYSHRWFAILGSLGICARAQINRFYNASLCADLYTAVTGVQTDRQGLVHRADRVWTLLRMANLREGLDRKADAIPQGWSGAGGFKDYVTEQPVDRVTLEGMVEEYYDEQGWDPKTGVPTEAKLAELGLTECL
jgi:aldehyde:ferredoxin oxidoreductase